MARACLERLGEPIRFGDALLAVGASVGIACARESDSAPAQLVAAADATMYDQKRQKAGRS